ncbi:MAG: Uncharacterized protein G01um101448_156 [Parcubacteria group bacterium Gr01-1014_48]|nr:MAG: Uncharacterized protein Greene041614_111 [Parcubacteria group bacterium Greene0416_14]TSC74429.1 MAG: Uncharacterized protein G01um101448_156 [Parcubacteria group bacterium Gr01-1014_48]TSD01282.1 MAG: Uncharacterized protein Greene101415_371 [Parcubacteria group bacterium Greene1014_15]TSD08397.1 MAG: Uncharacterized protein Greene07144_113 [Parcubacteria group bacterium Greene0714_4]
MENENKSEMHEEVDVVRKSSYVSRKADKTERQEKQKRSNKWRERMYWGIPCLIIVGITVWLFTLPRKPVSPAVKGKNHIHATLAIVIDGTPVTIPGGIGIPVGGGAVHIPGAQQVIHTHVENDQLHIEATTGGPLHEDDTKLSTFFRIWGKEFNATTILEKTTLMSGTLQFKVNGVENMEFQNYQMRDGDKLEIIYSSGIVDVTATTSDSF